ncbi:MAG: SIMPL domain-containing protein [Clostridiaceae bacterium]
MFHMTPFNFYQGYYRHPQLDLWNTNMSEYKMNINGKGTVMVKPDIAVVDMGVVTENINLKTAQAENAAKATALYNTLIENGVLEKDIITESYTITPEYDYVEGKQIFRGYKVSNIFKVTMRDLSRVGEIIDAAVASGANIVNSIRFTSSNSEFYYRQALNIAIDEAIKKAKSIEKNLDIVVNKVPFSITEQSLGYAPVYEKALFNAPISVTTPISSGEIEISASVNVVFIYSASL